MPLQHKDPTKTTAWAALTDHFNNTQTRDIKAAFASEENRAANFTIKGQDF